MNAKLRKFKVRVAKEKSSKTYVVACYREGLRIGYFVADDQITSNHLHMARRFNRREAGDKIVQLALQPWGLRSGRPFSWGVKEVAI